MGRPISGKTIRERKINHAKSLVKAAYYSAASDSPSMDFSFATDINMQEALISDLNTLRTRIRYELRQNGPAKGLCRVYANACIATGPTLSIDVDQGNEVFASEAEFAWSEWARNCGFVRNESLTEILHIGVRQFFTAGEYFTLNKTDPKAAGGVHLKLLQIRPDRVSSPYTADAKIIEGVKFSDDGRPIGYYISDENNNWNLESGENVRHVFYQESPEQVRGEPWLASGLSDLHKRRRYDEARVAAAIIAAKFALFITNNDPQISLTPDQLLPEDVIGINDGAATVLPPHYNVQSFSGSQPTTGAEDFRREMIANAGSAIGMSSNLSNQDSSGSNFASARYDDVGVSIEYKIVRDIIANRDLTPIANKFLAEAAAVKEIPPLPDWYRLVWRWAASDRHTDPNKAANADLTRIESGVDSYAQIWSEHGVAKEQRRQEIIEEVNWYRENNFKHPLDALIDKQNQARPQPEPEQEEE